MLMFMDAQFLNVKEQRGVKDPSKMYYSINLFDGVDTCNFNLAMECLKSALVCKCNDLMRFHLQYNPAFKTLRVVDIQPLPEVSSNA